MSLAERVLSMQGYGNAGRVPQTTGFMAEAAAGDSEGSTGLNMDLLKKLAPAEQRALSQHVRTLDQFLTTVSAALPVDLMPGTLRSGLCKGRLSIA